MLAPPKPPQPEVLIPEARERQRRRRVLAVVAIASLAAAALVAHAIVAGNGTARARATGPEGVPACSLGSLAVQAVDMSSPTGLGRTALAFTNRSGTACRGAGYPIISFGDSAGTIPFTYAHVGTATPVTITPNGTAYVVVSKFRCDIGTERVATTATVSMGAGSRSVALLGPALCKPGIAAEGRTVIVYPFERSLQAASEGSLAETP